MGVVNPDGTALPVADLDAGLVADIAEIQAYRDASAVSEDSDVDIAPQPIIKAYLTYPNFYRIKKWNNSNWYALAIAELADKLK
jgi:membrane-bound lytic murein transglycosylase B